MTTEIEISDHFGSVIIEPGTHRTVLHIPPEFMAGSHTEGMVLGYLEPGSKRMTFVLIGDGATFQLGEEGSNPYLKVTNTSNEP